jgi:hypothetical protein
LRRLTRQTQEVAQKNRSERVSGDRRRYNLPTHAKSKKRATLAAAMNAVAYPASVGADRVIFLGKRARR